MPDPIIAPGLVSVEHTFDVPLDHARPDGPRIEVFAREIADPDGRDRPLLVYFQGGPGFEALRPTVEPRGPGLVDRALRDFRLLALDQRGTGRSTPVGHLPGLSPAEQAEYLRHFRADSIVRDAEHIRQALGVDRWSVLGQSFGGFCVMQYLSTAPEGLREALITGGVPPLRRSVDEVYEHTYAAVRQRNRRYFKRFPQDRARADELRQRLESDEIRLPCGDRLTWRRLRQLGSMLGMSDGAELLHYILELPFDSPAFLHDVETSTGFARNPIYAILHEACYADGGVTGWAASRRLPDDFVQDGLFTGEHVYPWMFEEYGALVPLAQAAEILARESWPVLYDPDRLSVNEVPVAAAVYADDMFVERRFSQETAARTRGMRVWLTNEFEHNGLRADPDRVFGRLLDMVRGRA